MDASANLVSLDICVMNRCVPQHASKDMANASLDFRAPRYLIGTFPPHTSN